jgi:L-lactate dehydrogenase
MKVSIIGGGGRVGSDAAFALQIGALVREIALVDTNEKMVAGEALDLRHGSSLMANQVVTSGGFDKVAGSDVVVVTAGLRRKPDESRMELIGRNVGTFSEILDHLKSVSLPSHAVLMVVSNPVDILTNLAARSGLLPRNQVIGLGTVLDTARFRSLIAQHFGVGSYDVKALILGEHGDSMVPIWSSATINGVPLKSISTFSEQTAQEVFDQTKKSGAEVIRQRGGASRAVGVSIRQVVEAILLDKRQALPITSLHEGHEIADGIAMSLPTVVGRQGVVEVLKPVLDDDEREGLYESSEVIRKVWDRIKS